MLTPAQIKSHRFQQAGRSSYKMVEVDEFFGEVVDSYEQMFKENAELIRKISRLADKVEEYRNDENNIRDALITAQRMSEQIIREAKDSIEGKIEEAQEKADEIFTEAQTNADTLKHEAEKTSSETINNAQIKADKLVSDAQKKADTIIFNAQEEGKKKLGDINRSVLKESLVLERIQKEVSNFRTELISMYKSHVELIDKLPSIVEEETNTEKAKAEEVMAEEAMAEETQAEEAKAEEAKAEELELNSETFTVEQAEPLPKETQPLQEGQPELEYEESPSSMPVDETQSKEEAEQTQDDSDDIQQAQEQANEEEPQKIIGGFKVNLDEITPPSYLEVKQDTDEEEEENGGFKSFFKKK